MSTSFESAQLILKLYELRRDETLRRARDWFFLFNPDTLEEVMTAARGTNSAYFRMVTSYWEMAASLVSHGAIDRQMFLDANGEYLAVFAKVSPFLAQLREAIAVPHYLQHLEGLVKSLPDAEARLEAMRQRARAVAAGVAAQPSGA